jgi:hypothetical protein
LLKELVEIFDNPIEWIKSRPEMFLWQQNRGLQLLTNILSDALLLTDGQITALKKNEWWIAGSNVDWLSVNSNFSSKELFARMIAMPEAGQNSIRGEVLLTAFAKDVVTIANGQLSLVKGSIQGAEDFLLELNQKNDWTRLVTFRMGEMELP